MKLIVQIPCYNEEATLPETVAAIPRRIEGIDKVEILVIDDGSSDRTVEIARTLGVDHIVTQTRNRGLANAFRTGLDACLKAGADIIVNTDGDNQYSGADIPRLVQPILDGRADIVVGDRKTAQVAHFSPLKKILQKLGSWVVRQLSGLQVPDAVSGFRAISRGAALRLNIVSGFSYTIEMLIQAGRKRMAVASVPIATNKVTRQSRLFKSIPNFIKRSVTTMLRIYAMYQPLKVFAIVGAVLAVVGVLPIFRFLYFYAIGDGEGHVQSLILGGALVIIAVVSFLIGLVADLIAFNRQLLEITLEKVREMELNLARMEEERRAAVRPAGRPEIGLAATQGEARLLARSIAERSPSGTGRS
ncbi:MAG TPA: glycosyltransferase family 2 protein [Dongiaceae bacterium]|nr:glycosyltransferase family 2 protein [Dongiaceae bacterium]